MLGRDLFVVVRMFGLSDLHAKAEAKALLNVLTGRPYFQPPCQKPLLVIQCTLFRKCGENYRYVIYANSEGDYKWVEGLARWVMKPAK